MYIPAAFHLEDQAALDLIETQPFATLVSLGRDGLLATPLPWLLDRSGPTLRLIGHVARANPHWRLLDPGTPSLAIFQGGDGYVTPSWYAAKQETAKVVPTWNYIAVHVHGRLSVVEEPAALRDIVARLTDRHEAGRPTPWALSDAPEDFIAANLKAIVGLVLEVERVEGKAKLSQNRSAPDRERVRAGMAGILDIP